MLEPERKKQQGVWIVIERVQLREKIGVDVARVLN